MQKYNCKTCGAELYFDSSSQKLTCEYCGSSFDVTEYENVAETEPTAKQDAVPVEAGEYDKATDESEGELVVYKCSQCGAEIVTGKTTIATTCVYCNRAVTIEGQMTGAFKPDLVLPFVKEKDDFIKEYSSLCKRSVLTPKKFKEENEIQKVKGVYIPFWLHSMNLDTVLDITAKNVTSWRSGNMQYTKTDTYKVYESAQNTFTRIPADALARVDNSLMDSIEPFDYSSLKAFHPGYLAGYYTERYDEDATATLLRAQERAKTSMQDQMLAQVTGYSSKTVDNNTTNFKNSASEYALLPVWMMYTEYKGKNYLFGMNGQTGKTVGKIPVAKGRLFSLALIALAGSQLVCLIIRMILALL